MKFYYKFMCEIKIFYVNNCNKIHVYYLSLMSLMGKIVKCVSFLQDWREFMGFSRIVEFNAELKRNFQFKGFKLKSFDVESDCEKLFINVLP